ncbi:MAG: hypothetical protein HY914_16590 [Desulfomonile tiedjei]|nr:hypothetical protein [Desulfomonile tiedjei]
MTEPDFSARLDPLSELPALAGYANTKNVIITAIETTGRLDAEALKLAVKQTSEKYPQIRCCIREVHERGRFHLLRQPRPDLETPVFFADLPESDTEAPLLDRFLNFLSPRLDRNWDLFNELPAEFHFVKVSPDRHILAPVLHHVVADAGIAAELGREWLLNYHRIVTGTEPQLIGETPGISTSVKRRVRTRRSWWKGIGSDARDVISALFEHPTLPVGSSSPDDSREYHVKRVFSVEDTEEIARLSRVKTGSLVDLLAVCANLAIDQWNEARSQPPGMLTTTVSVNMRGRYREIHAANNSGQLFFKSMPEERTDAAAFARSLAIKRIAQFRRQMDFKFFQDVSRLTKAVSVLPFHLRRRLVHFLMDKHQYSVAMTVLGVIWPAFKNGRPTADTCLTRVGDLNIEEVHGIGYKLLSATRLLFIVYTFRNRLNLVLAASGNLFTRQEADEFMDLVLANLVRTLEIVGKPARTASNASG